MTTWTAARAEKLAAYLASHHLPRGIGTKKAACSVAAINLAINGRLTDDVPACMSEVVGRWVIVTQDAMSDEGRNSDGWKSLLPLAAGTGRKRESERLTIVRDAMWEALAWVQPRADKGGYGAEWATMLRERTRDAARAATSAAKATSAALAAQAAAAADATDATDATYAADAALAAYTYAATYDEWAIRTLGRLVA